MKFTYTLMEIFWLSIKRYKSQRKLKRERERERERERDQQLSQFIGRVRKAPSTNAEGTQEVTNASSKCKFKSDLAEKNKQLNKTRKMLS